MNNRKNWKYISVFILYVIITGCGTVTDKQEVSSDTKYSHYECMPKVHKFVLNAQYASFLTTQVDIVCEPMWQPGENIEFDVNIDGIFGDLDRDGNIWSEGFKLR